MLHYYRTTAGGGKRGHLHGIMIGGPTDRPNSARDLRSGSLVHGDSKTSRTGSEQGGAFVELHKSNYSSKLILSDRVFKKVLHEHLPF